VTLRAALTESGRDSRSGPVFFPKQAAVPPGDGSSVVGCCLSIKAPAF